MTSVSFLLVYYHSALSLLIWEDVCNACSENSFLLRKQEVQHILYLPRKTSICTSAHTYMCSFYLTFENICAVTYWVTGKNKAMEKSMSDIFRWFRIILQFNVGVHKNSDLMLQKWQFLIYAGYMCITTNLINTKITFLSVVWSIPQFFFNYPPDMYKHKCMSHKHK